MSDQLDLLLKFKQLYRDFSVEQLQRLPSIYAENIVFQDPVHKVQGLGALESYFRGMTEDLLSCRFTFESESSLGASATRPSEQEMYFVWRMDFCHRRLGGGKPIAVRGITKICFDSKVTFHEDFYDMGAMLYERVPVLGWFTRKLKQRLAASIT